MKAGKKAKFEVANYTCGKYCWLFETVFLWGGWTGNQQNRKMYHSGAGQFGCLLTKRETNLPLLRHKVCLYSHYPFYMRLPECAAYPWRSRCASCSLRCALSVQYMPAFHPVLLKSNLNFQWKDRQPWRMNRMTTRHYITSIHWWKIYCYLNHIIMACFLVWKAGH